MPTTLNPAHPLRGPRSGKGPLPGLRVREDHRQWVTRPQTGDRDPGSTGAPRAGQAMTALRRALRALRHVNGELLHAPGTVMRLARAPYPRLHAPVPPGGKPRNAQRRTAGQPADCADCPICRVSFPL